MLPIVALVGRPNVGKSTLFNVLTGTRDAIVADVPGVTRDRQYGYSRDQINPFVVIDTGGVVENLQTNMQAQMRRQTEKAVEEADRLIFIADARGGLTSEDHFVAAVLRKSGKPITLAINKAEGLDSEMVSADFHALGFGNPVAISAEHRQGCDTLMEVVLEGVAPPLGDDRPDPDSIRIAIIGRPNVGKSTLINRLVGEERVIATDEPGTTRDSIFVPFERDERKFILIDTAGVRRKSKVDKVDDAVERASVAKTLQAIAESHVVIMVTDAHDVIGEQDASVLGIALERGRAIIIAVNKWDGIPVDQRDAIKNQLALKLDFVQFAPVFYISARHGTAVGDVARAAIKAFDAAMREMPTPQLTRVLIAAMQAHQPPIRNGRRIKLRYAHQGGKNPPRIVIHGNQTSSVPDAYTRYLCNTYRKAFDLYATPVAVEYPAHKNPFDPSGTRAQARKTAAANRPKMRKKTANRAVKNRPAQPGPTKRKSTTRGPTKKRG
ncbi:MAG: ribosome biogenesis GTPase Der [Steroidobacteraceae bacterium]